MSTATGRSGAPERAGGLVVELPATPGLAGLYGRGVVGSARAAVSRRRSVRPGSLPTTHLRVSGVRPDPTHLSDYQHLLHEGASDVLPAGFVHVLAFPVATALMVRADFPLPLLGMVHVANRVEQRRGLRLGEVLDVEVHVRGLAAHRAGVTVDVVAEVSVDGERAWEGVSTYLAKGIRLDGAEQPDGGRETFEAPVPTGQWRLGADVGQRYAAVSGDRNPIHTTTLAAKAFGFPRTIAHGMHTAARALAAVGPARGEAYRWDVEFAKPVLLPSTVAVRVAPDDDGFGYAVWDPRKGTPHLTGSVTPLR
ncbi:MaoC/PaaZ C-terminal domain-containing protein [Actinotalea sp. AC32]|nr:MaoC/PaaZ C-terminal domain-containing protein [Actinotalea sp. AC32]